MSFFETANNPVKRAQYHLQARQSVEEIRKICNPHMSPLDLFHLHLEEIWPNGAHIERIQGMKMQSGTVRLFHGDMENTLPPHQDILEREVPQSERARTMQTQLAANIYLKVPDQGGELELWDVRLTDKEFEQCRNHTHDFIERDKLPPSKAIIQPEEGELILFQVSQSSYGTCMQRKISEWPCRVSSAIMGIVLLYPIGSKISSLLR